MPADLATDGDDPAADPEFSPPRRVPVDELSHHPENREIYGEEPVSGLAAQIESEGFNPANVLTARPDGTVVCGNRRLDAARKAGLDTVPVVYREFEDGDEEVWALIMDNVHQRERTPTQKMREADRLEPIYEERAKERMAWAAREGTDPDTPRPNLDEGSGPGESGRTDEQLAADLGIGGKDTYRKLRSVWEKAQEGLDEAQAQLEDLDAGEQSIHGAYEETQQAAIRDRFSRSAGDSDSDDERAESVGDGVESAGTSEENRPPTRPERPQRPHVFRHRPYLDARAQEILNRSARRIANDPPEFVDDPYEPSVAECLRELQHPSKAEDGRPSGHTRRSAGSKSGHRRVATQTAERFDVDRAIVVDLLDAGLDFQEVVYWMLYEYGGLDPVAIWHAEESKEKSYSADLERHARRNVHSVLRSAAEKLDVDFEPGRSDYMYDPDTEGGDGE